MRSRTLAAASTEALRTGPNCLLFSVSATLLISRPAAAHDPDRYYHDEKRCMRLSLTAKT
jgi:hypothetical protein